MSDLDEHFFFTELDPQASVKGSRDPLGIQAIWSGLGRYVVGNLTTVTQSLRGFTTLIVGLHLTARVAELEPNRPAVDTFLMWEELAAYARCCFYDRDGLLAGLIGVRRGRPRSRQSSVVLSPASADQILGNQRSNGLWGLYVAAARSSGLVDDRTPPRLTADGQEIVHRLHLPLLAKRWGAKANGLVELLAHQQVRVEIGRGNRGFAAVADVLRPRLRADEAPLYRRHLVDGGPVDETQGRQARLARTMTRLDSDHVPRLIPDADDDLASRLRDIEAAESVLAPAGALFGYTLSREGDTLAEIAGTVKAEWGNRLASVSPRAASVLPDPWLPVAWALREGTYEPALEHLLRINQDVMGLRGDFAAWAALDGGRLVVRFRDDVDTLPTGSQVRGLWRNPYFIPSLYSILRAVQGADAP